MRGIYRANDAPFEQYYKWAEFCDMDMDHIRVDIYVRLCVSGLGGL